MIESKPYTGKVSIKGIVFEDGKIWLRKNERNEWELPGGKLDVGEQPEETVVRELEEELGFKTKVEKIIDASMYTIQKSPNTKVDVLVITYLCELIEKVGDFETMGEAGKAEFANFGTDEIISLKMPEFYKEAIRKAHKVKNVQKLPST
ncbi:NUDIX domain-containing protein [Candidatus Dojkabacteria bacterium]|nr:NUDIX domain-containing protein [Candidatus Dojkabacteria bacterium]